ncbi:uncharacterized protein LOC130647431 isoform X2 [Hydractinia symbiolongicarpus]|uniref:uncharacterized protein LOC130647431 isoform X2 n=1 Tax=Hydractinia symbiolongicarpus TaxID=13093 RepID=UPI00254CB718|nr:uncharacterized protein LOC130647431 isoform X2 [Hydractinia symbiolongicarpus]
MIYNWIVIWLVTSFLFALPVHQCYSVSRMTSGDIVRDFVSNCSEINAKITNATGCLCPYNGTFISHQNLSSCHPNVNKLDALGLRNIYSVPLAKLINGTWRLPNRPMMFLRNNQTVNIKRCPSLFIDSNNSSYEYMVDYGWMKAYEYNFFRITTDAMNNYHIKLQGDSMYWGGFLVRVWLDCRTNSSKIKFSFLLKFEGEVVYTIPFTGITETPVVYTTPVTDQTEAPVDTTLQPETTLPKPLPKTKPEPPTKTPSTTTSQQQRTTAIDESGETNQNNIGAIVGGVVGGVVFLILLVAILCCLNKRRVERKELSRPSPWTIEADNPIEFPMNSDHKIKPNGGNEGMQYIQPNEWASFNNNLDIPQNPPPVPDSPRPSQYHSYEYPVNDAYLPLSNDEGTMKNSEGAYADLKYGVVPSNYASGSYEHPSLNQQQCSKDLYMEFTQNGAQSSYSE